MRKALLFILVAATISTACHKKSSKQCPIDEYTYTFANSSRLDTTSRPLSGTYSVLMVNVVPGDKRVFTYRRIHTECPEIADGDFTGILVFEADPTASHFEYSLDSLGAVKCYYETSCYGCGGAIVPTGGTIKGSKTSDNKWKIDVDLKLGSSSVLKFSADFIPGQ
jgi:hypothetical protein